MRKRLPIEPLLKVDDVEAGELATTHLSVAGALVEPLGAGLTRCGVEPQSPIAEFDRTLFEPREHETAEAATLKQHPRMFPPDGDRQPSISS